MDYRTAHRIIKARRQATKAHSKGLHTMRSHALRAGIDPVVADGLSGAVRNKAKQIGVTGQSAVMVRKTECGIKPVKGARRYSKTDLLAAVTAYNPRAAKYVAGRAALLAYAAA